MLREGTANNMELADVLARTKGWADKKSDREAIARDPTRRDKQDP